MNIHIQEQLFLKYFLSTFKLGEVVYNAPENWAGYKAHIDHLNETHPTAKQVLFNFKLPVYDAERNAFSFQIYRKEQEVMANLYPTKAAWYIVPVYTSTEVLTNAQITNKSSDSFARGFVAIAASSIDYGTSKIHFDNFKYETSKPKPYFSKNGNQIFLHPDQYTKSNLLAKLIKSKDIGIDLELLENRLDKYKHIWSPNIDAAEETEQVELFPHAQQITFLG